MEPSSRLQAIKAPSTIDGPTINRLDAVFDAALQKGKNITPEARKAINTDYFANRAVIKDERKLMPENTEEYIEATFNAQSAIMDKLRAGLYPPPRPEESFLMDAELLRREQVEAAFKAVCEAAKSTVIARGGIITSIR